MENYFYLSAGISLLVLAIINYGEGSCTANYYLSSFAIIAWFIPYPILAGLIPEEILMEPLILSFTEFSLAKSVSSEQSMYFDVDLWLMWSLFSLMAIGALLFIKRLFQSFRWRNQVMKDSSLVFLDELSDKYQTPVYAVNKVSSGLLLGIVNPIILLSSRISNPQHINLIIAHEQQHIKNHDNLRLLLLEITECLFWWNPLVGKLVKENRFLIELRCDESASEIYGQVKYIEDLAALILSNHHSLHNSKPHNLVCSATSSITNNVARIKLLKEKRRMTFRKKITYAMVALATLTTMSWNTLAISNNNEQVQRSVIEKEQLGALIDFDITVTYDRYNNPEKESYTESVITSNMTIWVNFEEKASITVGENFTFNFKAKDLGELVSLEYELIELNEGNKKTISKPRLTVEFGQEALIEIDNLQVSKNGYSIKATPVKALNPS